MKVGKFCFLVEPDLLGATDETNEIRQLSGNRPANATDETNEIRQLSGNRPANSSQPEAA